MDKKKRVKKHPNGSGAVDACPIGAIQAVIGSWNIKQARWRAESLSSC